MIVSHDGGISITQNRGKSWLRVELPIAQMYHVTVDDRIPYYVYGNRQDGPSARGPSNSRTGDIARGQWSTVGGGESGFATPDPGDSNIVWSSASGSGAVGGIVTRYDLRTGIGAARRGLAGGDDRRAGERRAVPVRLELPAHLLAVRPHHAVRGQPARARHHRRRRDVEGDQPRPHAQRHHARAALGRTHARQHRCRVRRRRLLDRRVAPQARADLGRHQRRPGAADARRRHDLDERDAQHPRTARLGHDLQHRAVPVRHRDRLPHGGRPPGRQLRPVDLPDHGLRGDVDADHHRHPALAAQLRARGEGGPGAPRPALRGHGERPLRVARRRGALAAAAEQPAARPRVRDRGAGAVQRPGHRHVRARLLDPRRRHAAPHAQRRRGRARRVALRRRAPPIASATSPDRSRRATIRSRAPIRRTARRSPAGTARRPTARAATRRPSRSSTPSGKARPDTEAGARRPG